MAPVIQGSETGVPGIDAGNEGLRFLLGRVFQPGVECRRGMGGRGDCDFNACSRIRAIMRYVERNFAHQEQVMSESAYPDTDRHRNDHAGLLEHLEVMLRSQVCADKEAGRVHDFIAHWVVDHAHKCDRPLGRWAVSRRVMDPRR